MPTLTADHLEMRDMVRELARARVAPRAAEIDREGVFPQDMRRLLAEHDILGLPFKEEHGGTGTDTLTLLMGIEELSAACATTGLILACQELGGLALKLAGTPDQQERWLPRLASGEWLPAYCLTEPESGSDSAAMRSRAVRDGDHYVINGTKRFITNAGVADLYTVFAKTDPEARHKGISCFVVEAETPGLSVPKVESKMGIRGSVTGDVQLDDVRVPADQLVGREGEGFSIAMRVLDRSRPGIAAQALGIGQGALDYALGYMREREAFGKPLTAFQGLQWMLADMATELEAGRQLLYTAAQLLDDPDADPSTVTRYSAMAKLKCGDTAMKVTTDAVQLLGGYGYTQEYPVERMMRDAKICQIYEGTQQIQRLVVAKHLIGR